jgi:hypothetical protein
VQTNAAGQVVLKLKTAWRDGTTHLVMSPLEFMQRLAALVPRPRLHLIRFHGVLVPNAKLRAQVVPQMVPQEPEPPMQAAPPAECEATCAHLRPVRLSWAKLLKRVFEIDMAHCPNCGGELKIIAAILEQPVIEKILTHLGLELQSAGPGAAAHASPWVATASGLRPASQHVSGGPVTRAAGIGCATASQSRGLAADCKGKPKGNPFERLTSALRSAFNVRQIDPRAGSVGDREPCRRAFGSKKCV